MPITEAAVARLLAPLREVRPITSKKMFGGVGIYCDGVFFAVIDNDRLYVKSDAETDAAFDEVEAEPWVIEGEIPQVMPYREVPQAILGDAENLGPWIDRAVGVAVRKKKPRRGHNRGA